jgi:hypothetical protein
MKLQCPCGAKYEFELTADMLQNPVQFVCPACGLDSSAAVNELVRQQFGAATEAPLPVATPARVRVHAPQAQSEPAEVEAEAPAQRCHRHPDQETVESCYVCRKPICPKCMELFGYVCSPLCKAKAESHGIAVPVYAGQRSVREARQWRRVVWLSAAAAVVVAACLGAWFWYAWFGSTPKIAYAHRFNDPAYSGHSAFAGADQIVFLHGDLLARHDTKTKQEIWSRHLIDPKQIEATVNKEVKELEALIYKANNEAWEQVPTMPPREKMIKRAERAAAAAMELRLIGKNLWVISEEKVTRFDLDSGKPLQEIALDTRHAELIPAGNELLLLKREENKKPVITHINLETCDSRVTGIDGVTLAADAAVASPGGNGKGGKTAMAGLPVGAPGRDRDKALDPAKVEEQAQRLSYPAKIALPAILSNQRSQERAMAELDSDRPRQSKPAGPQLPKDEMLSIIPSPDGFVQYSEKLLEEKVVSRSAMKVPSGKSALDGPVSVAHSADVANEILNEMQRDRGGDQVIEDESRYLVNLRRNDGSVAWSGEVAGHPTLFPLRTVNVLAANKTIMVFDKAHKKLWQGTLNYPISGDSGALEEGASLYGQGPCVERTNTLFVADQGVLTAFDLGNGNARWRLPSVGIAGLFFDDHDGIYVNTTSAGLDSLKFSRQIDITRKTSLVVKKIRGSTGEVLWTAELGGLLSYVSGKFIYTVASYQPDDDEDSSPYTPDTGFETPPYVRIKRIDPKNGHVLWEHFQQRAPLDVAFDQNAIRLVFKKEVQVLRFWCL